MRNFFISNYVGNDANVSLVAPKGNQHTNTNLHLFLPRLWNGIGEETVERQRKNDVDEQDLLRSNKRLKYAKT